VRLRELEFDWDSNWGIGALAPNRRGDLARLGLRAMLAGTMANLMSASIAGMLY